MTESSSERPSVRVPFVLVALGFVSLALLAILVGTQIWQSYGSALPKSLFHVPNDSSYAARVQLPNPELEPALAPLLEALNASRLSGQAPRRERLAERLGHDWVTSVTELALARGPKDADWLITASGEAPPQGLLEAVSEILKEEGWTWSLDAARGTLTAPEGIALGLATDGTLIVASNPNRLVRAQKRDTGEPSRNVAHGVFPDLEELSASSAELAKRLKVSSGPRPSPGQ